MVRRALPSVWSLASPADALRARESGAVRAIRRLLGLPHGAAAPRQVRAAADLLAAAADDLDPAGHAVGAPNLELPVPEEPVARLWHAATLLREHRGDGHVAALVAAGINGAEACMLRIGTDLAVQAGAPAHVAPGWGRDQMPVARGWTDAELDGATLRLAERGLLTGSGQATAAGLALHRAIEDATDVAAARPWGRLGPERSALVAGLLHPIAVACARGMPFPNPVGVPAPADAGLGVPR
jgi:hypothetical protein